MKNVINIHKNNLDKMQKVYNIIVIGGVKSGKTSFIAKCNKNNKETRVNTNYGLFIIRMWSTLLLYNSRPRPKFDGYIIICDATSHQSCKIGEAFYKQIKNIPKILVINKIDLHREKTAADQAQEFCSQGIDYCEISVENGQNIDDPFLFLIKNIVNCDDLVMV